MWIFFDIFKYFFKIINYIKIKKFFHEIKNHKNIFISGNLNINRIPIIDIRENCQLHIGNNVTLNSNNDGYHVNMHSSVKLLADRPGAIIKIGNNTRINGSCIHAYHLVKVGDNCLIAANCQIFDGNGHDISFPDVANRINTFGSYKPVVIEDNVWIGINTVICPGVTIGKGSIVSANSVVSRDVPPMTIVAGNPAIVVKEYNNYEIV